MKKIATTVLSVIVFGCIVVIFYSIFCNASGILESFTSLPVGYLISGVIGAIVMFIALKLNGCVRIPMAKPKIKKPIKSETSTNSEVRKPVVTTNNTRAGSKK